MRILGADVDIALGRADREPGDRHAFDQQEGVAFHQHAIGERAAVALVGVTDDVFLTGLDASGRAPFDAGREACATTPTKAGGQNFFNRRLGTQRQRAFKARKSAMTAIVVERERVSQPAAREDEPLLFCEVRNVLDAPQRFGMSATAQKVRVEKLNRLARRDRSVPDTPCGCFDLDQRLKPEEAARSGAHKLNVEAAAASLVVNCFGDEVRADRERRRIPRDEDADAHCTLPCAAATIASIRSQSRRPTGAPSSKAAGERAQLPRQ